jgi:antitoxin HicB
LEILQSDWIAGSGFRLASEVIKDHYSLLIQWSEADQLYLVTIPEFTELVMQPCTSGKTYLEALENAQDCIESCLDYWDEIGTMLPAPAVLQAA